MFPTEAVLACHSLYYCVWKGVEVVLVTQHAKSYLSYLVTTSYLLGRYVPKLPSYLS